MKLFGVLSLFAVKAEDDECAPNNGKVKIKNHHVDY
jgi:hypothetical protein